MPGSRPGRQWLTRAWTKISLENPGLQGAPDPIADSIFYLESESYIKLFPVNVTGFNALIGQVNTPVYRAFECT